MVLTVFQWRYGGRQVYLCGSFESWSEHYPMTLLEASPTVFQTICDLPTGIHQFRFLVDGVWRCDEQFPIAFVDGMVNNVIDINEPNILSPVPHYDPYLTGTMHVSSLRDISPETLAFGLDAETEIFRSWVSSLLSNQTIFDILPMSSKVFIVDGQLPVKEAFRIMLDKGLAVVPIWDDHRAIMAGMLTASDLMLIVRELQNNEQMLAKEILEIYSVTSWKERKLQLYGQSSVLGQTNLRPLIHVSDLESMRDTAITILQNEISAVPIFRSVSLDSSTIPLLNLANLPVILKNICNHWEEVIGMLPLLHYPISRIPLGTWLPKTGKDSRNPFRVLPTDAPLSFALCLLLEERISSIPIVNNNGTFVDVFSRRDMIALAKDDMYVHVQFDQITIDQALDLVYRANAHYNRHRECPTCFASTPFFEIIEKLSHPDVRRLVVIDRCTRQVEGIISLRDVAGYILG